MQKLSTSTFHPCLNCFAVILQIRLLLLSGAWCTFADAHCRYVVFHMLLHRPICSTREELVGSYNTATSVTGREGNVLVATHSDDALIVLESVTGDEEPDLAEIA